MFLSERLNASAFVSHQPNQFVACLSLLCPLVFVTLSCTFRYGRDDTDVMGIAFRRELYLSTRQVYPPLLDGEKRIHTRTQAKLMRKLGDNAYPFLFEVRRNTENTRTYLGTWPRALLVCS